MKDYESFKKYYRRCFVHMMNLAGSDIPREMLGLAETAAETRHNIRFWHFDQRRNLWAKERVLTEAAMMLIDGYNEARMDRLK